jgi:hypothetical protein
VALSRTASTVGHWPDDVEVKSISRTVGQNRVIDELIISFTHDREMRVFLPGVAPAGRKVVLANVVVMGFDDAGRVAYDPALALGELTITRLKAATISNPLQNIVILHCLHS